MPLPPPIVCVISRARGAERSQDRSALLDRLAAAASAGASMIQVRERLLDDRALLAFVRDLVRVVAATPCRVVVNDRPDIALAGAAAGVHLKSNAVSAADVRRIVPGDFLIGRSVHSDEEAASVEEAGGCDYLLFGTVFSSASKPEDHPIAGTGALRRACERVSLPVLAIGGVTPARARDVRAAGAAGAAAISFFSDARDIASAVVSLRAALTPSRGNV